MGVLAYFILVTDALPDPIYIDDIALLAAAIATISNVIQSHHHQQAKDECK
jgi:uncharacterized membrane protein YkvA (DUF1232 family)